MALEVVKKEISLNVGQPNNFELICAMQGDNKSFEITATLYDVNKLYTINTDNIKLKGVNPLGSNLYKDVKGHTANTVTFALTEDMLAYDGLLKLVLVLAESSTQLTTFPFVIKVVNSPGNTNADDMQTVSALVEEAKKWAMLSKSYAVGTDNEVRKGDAKDNSKYYYEQIKELYDSGKIGNGKILYFETYEEFKKELDAGKVENETLICIKEGNGGGNSGGDDDKSDNDFTDRILLVLANNPYILTSNDAKKWEIIKGQQNLPVTNSEGYEMLYIEELNMLFIIHMSRAGWVFYTTRDFNDEASNIVWKILNVNNNGCLAMAYGNDCLVIVSSNGKSYAANKNEILSKRNSETISFNFSEGNITTGLTKNTNLLFADGIFIIVSYDKRISYYSTDGINWNDISANIQYYNLNNFNKLVYGNGMFLHYYDTMYHENSKLKEYFAFLSAENPSNGWYYLDNIPEPVIKSSNDFGCESYAHYITDIIFNNETNEFIMPFYHTETQSGFILYNGTNWTVHECGLPAPLYHCILLKGVLHGFMDNQWVCVSNIITGNFISYGNIINESGNIIGFSNIGNNGDKSNPSYVVLNKPLWDIDKDATIAANSQEGNV
ncbi:MAG: hypothetical protein HFH72_10245 [Lachnospiraceae bacterium]|nr:hypothetical protein [Lachnospiraceae bacterium]